LESFIFIADAAMVASVHGKMFHPSPIFADKAESHPVNMLQGQYLELPNLQMGPIS